MTTDELKNRLYELWVEYNDQRRIRKQLEKDIHALDEIMERNFSAYWNSIDKCYEQ